MPAERTLQTGIPDITAIQQERAVLSREITQIHQEIFSKKRVPLEQRTGEYWNKIKGDPERLELGIATAIDAGRNPSAKMSPADAQTALHNMVSEKLPRFMNALPSDERQIYCTRVASVLVASSINPNLPMSPATFTVVDSMISQLDPESRVTTAMAISTRANYFMQRLPMQEIKIPMGKESTITTKRKTPPRPETADYVKEMDKLLQDTGDELAADTENGNFSPQNLRTAIASLGFAHAEITTYIASSPSVKDLQAKAAKYLYDFVEHFTAYPSGYQDALMIAILAISEAAPQTQYELLSLLTHNHRVTYNNRQSTSLDSFLRTALTADSEDLDGIFFSLFTLSSSYQEANGGITQLENLLIQQFVSVDQITPQEQMMLIKRFLSFSTTYGINVASEHITEEELIGLFYGKLVLYYPEHTPGSPIYLIPNIENGISEFSRVIGEITGQETQDEDKQQDEEDQPDATPTPPIVDFIGEVYPLFETRGKKIIQELDKIFGDELTTEQIAALKQNHQDVWPTIYGPRAKRDRFFSIKGDVARLTRAKTSPRVVLRRNWQFSSYTSDMAGEIYFGDNLVVSFILDKEGIVSGPIADLYLAGELSEGRLLQISNRLSILGAAALRRDEKRQAEHAAMAHERAKKEVADPSGRIIKEKLQEIEKLAEERGYLVVTRDPQTGEPTGEFFVNEEKIRQDLEEGQTHATIPIPRVGTGRKGKVIDDPATGFRVFLPLGQLPSEAAAANADFFGVPIPSFRVYSLDPDTGLLIHTTDGALNTTFRSVRKPEGQLAS